MFFKKLTMPLLAITVGFTSVAFANTGSSKSELAILLPASDGVVELNSNRLVKETLPQVLSANPPLLDKLNREIDKIKTQTGMDLRLFDHVSIGLKNIKLADGSDGFDIVVLARGSLSTDSIETIVKGASAGEFKKEEIDGRTVYIFSPDMLVKAGKAGAAEGTLADRVFGQLLKGMPEEVALTAYDSNTFAFGSLARVKQLIGNSPRINAELIGLVNEKPDSLARMALMLPNGMSRFLDLDDDELGANLDSIRRIHGSFDMSEGTAVMSMSAKTVSAVNAEELAFSLTAMQGFFAGLLKENQGADKQAYGRMLENLEISQTDDRIDLELSVPKGDLDVIVGKK